MAATEHSQNIKKDTREWITLALLELIKTNKLPKLSISEVVKKAGVSRMAFYRNFESLEQVLEEYFEPIYADIFSKTTLQTNHEQKITDLTKFFDEHSGDFQLAIESEYIQVLYKIFKIHIARLYDKIVPFPDWTGAKRSYWIDFMSAGVFEVWVTWIKNGQKESLEEISALLRLFHK